MKTFATLAAALALLAATGAHAAKKPDPRGDEPPAATLAEPDAAGTRDIAEPATDPSPGRTAPTRIAVPERGRDGEGLFDAPGAFVPKPGDEPPPAMKGPFISLKDGRGVLESGAALALKRLPEGPSGHPVTKSITPFGDWNVACESRGRDQACSAAAYTQTSGIRLKAKFGIAAEPEPDPAPDPAPVDPAPARPGRKGAAAPPAKPARAAARRPGPARYVMELEGPPGLDVDTGYAIVGTRAAGFLSIERGCDRAACRATAEVSRDLAPLIVPGSDPNQGGFAVIASSNGTSFLWRFSTNGLKDAFDKVRSEAGRAGADRVSAADDLAPPPAGPPEAKTVKAEAKAPAPDAKAAADPLSPSGRPVRIVPIRGARARTARPGPHAAPAERVRAPSRRHRRERAAPAAEGRFVPGRQ